MKRKRPEALLHDEVQDKTDLAYFQSLSSNIARVHKYYMIDQAEIHIWIHNGLRSRDTYNDI